MGIITRIYKKRFVCRYDKQIGIPYYSYLDFLNFKQETHSFNNSLGVEIKYFFYYYDNYKEDKIILFCHGIGPGHAAYLREIESLAKHGYKVLTLDYMGCGESSGDSSRSLLEPTRDVIDLLNHLKLDIPVVLVGHSLGGFTSLNVLNMRNDISKAVIMSGFLSLPSLVNSMIHFKCISSSVNRYESKLEPEIYNLDNLQYLKTTKDRVLFIQSVDDNVVPYDISLKLVEQIDNKNIKTIKVSGRNHNPNYTDSAAKYLSEVFGQYNNLLKKKKIKTDEEKINYFKDVSLSKLTEQDEEIINQICNFIEG